MTTYGFNHYGMAAYETSYEVAFRKVGHLEIMGGADLAKITNTT